jgi:APA family basic amino acid/polyamine antiporter
VVTSLFNLPAVFITLAVTMLLVIGVSESATVNNIIVAIKVTVILAFIAVGAFFVNPDNWHPFIPEPTGVENQFGIAGVIRAATIVFFAYIGFEAVSTAGQEAKNPRKDMPIGILGSLIVCTVLYMATAAVLTGVVSFTKLNVAAPVATAVDTFGPQWSWLAKCIKIGAIAGLSSVVLVLMFGQTRVFYSMSRDGLLPKRFAVVHPKFKTPWINTLIVGRARLRGRRGLRHQPTRRSHLGGHAGGVRSGVFLGDLAALYATRSTAALQVWGYPVVPAIGVILCFVLAWIGVEHAIRVWFFWFLVGTVALYFVGPYWLSPMRNRPATAPVPPAS